MPTTITTSTLTSLDHCARVVQPAQPFTMNTASTNQLLRCTHTLLIRHEKHTNGMQVLSHKGFIEAPKAVGEQHETFTSPTSDAERKKVFIIIYVGPKESTLAAANEDFDSIRSSQQQLRSSVSFIGGTAPQVSETGQWVKLAVVYEGDPFLVLRRELGKGVVPVWHFWADGQLVGAGYARKWARREMVGRAGVRMGTRREILGPMGA